MDTDGKTYYVIGDATNAGVESSIAADNTEHPGTWGLGPWFDIDNTPTTQTNDVVAPYNLVNVDFILKFCKFECDSSATDRGLP